MARPADHPAVGAGIDDVVAGAVEGVVDDVVGDAPALDYATFVATDLAASLAFYDAALGALGLVRTAEFGDEEEDEPAVEAAGWGVAGGRAVLWVVAGSTSTRGAHVSLRARSRADVERFHAAALAAGGTSQATPRRWAIFRRGEFSAAVADPDGNLVEARAPE